MPFKTGDRVRHPKRPSWGIAEVLEDSSRERTRAFFADVGEKTISEQYVALEPVTGTEAESVLLDNLHLGRDEGVRYKSLPDSIEYFLERYPDGFHGERFLYEERNYKVKACTLAGELLGESALTKAIAAGDFATVCSNAQRVLNATNLVFPNEKMALRDGLREAPAQERFTNALYDLLYGRQALKARFEGLVACLSSIGADKWTTASYFQFLLNPAEAIFVKPTVTQNAASVCGFNIDYRSALNWITYSQVLKFAGYLRDGLMELEPRDMIDVQSFMWCIAPRN